MPCVAARSEARLGSSPLPQVALQAEALRGTFAAVDAITQTNLRRVLDAFREHRVGSHMF